MDSVSGLMTTAVMWIGGGVAALIVGLVSYLFWVNSNQMKGM